MRATAAVLLALLYVVAVGSMTAWDWLTGAALALLLLLAFRDFLQEPRGRGRVNPFRRVVFGVRLAVVILWEFWVGTLRVGRALAGRAGRPGLVEVPFAERSPAEVALTGFLTSVAPDEFLVDVDWERRVMIFHVIDAGAADEVRRRHDALYRDYVAPLFP
jgi:multisubunit Na+/H+ antiporter MnhE subunit